MSKYLVKNFMCWFVIAFCLLVISCGNRPSDNDTGKAVTANSSSTTASPAAQMLNIGPLDVLYTGRSTFDNLGMGTKLVFAHSVGANSKVLLSGWQQQGNQFPAGSKFDLINGVPSNVQLGTGVYISNVTLSPAETNKVKTALNNAGMLYVVFTPKMVDTYFIGYDITVSAGIPTLSSQVVNAIAEANPSPPRASD